MKLPCIFLLSVYSLLATRAVAEADGTTPTQAVDRASQYLQDLRGAIDKLKLQNLRGVPDKLGHAPDDVSSAYLYAYLIMQAADEYVACKEPVNAAFLYNEALAGLRALQTLRPDWQPKLVSYRVNKIDEKVRELALPTGHVQSPAPAVPVAKPLNPGQLLPGGWREFEFNSLQYYYVPLSSAPDDLQKAG